MTESLQKTNGGTDRVAAGVRRKDGEVERLKQTDAGCDIPVRSHISQPG